MRRTAVWPNSSSGEWPASLGVEANERVVTDPAGTYAVKLMLPSDWTAHAPSAKPTTRASTIGHVQNETGFSIRNQYGSNNKKARSGMKVSYEWTFPVVESTA
jgi:hypothetical protein